MEMKRIAIAVTSAIGMMAISGAVWSADGDDTTGTSADAPQKVYITGSSVKHIQGETSLPVQIITRQDIDRTGATTTTELLNSISAASSSGNTNPASNTLGVNMMSGASLRGLGYQRTLVLLNGRRVANNAMDGGGVDLETIPLSAVDRVEILEDGASAVYGADAVGGVINFILKKDYQGVEGSVYGTGTQHGGSAGSRANLTMGTGDLVEDKYNMFVTLEAGHDNSLNYTSRPQFNTLLLPPSYGPLNANGLGRYTNLATASTPGNAYSLDGTVAGNPSNPNCTAPNTYPNTDGTCLYDFGPFGQILPATTKYSLVSRMTFKTDNETEYYIETSLSRNSYVYGNYPTFADGSNTTADGTFPGFTPFTVNPGQQYYPTQWAANNGLSGQPIAFQSFLDELGPSTGQAVNDQYRLVLGTTGTAGGWDYDTGLNLNHAYSASYFTSGVVDTQKFYNLTLSGLYNPFGPQSPAGLAALQATQFNGNLTRANANVESWDLKLSRSLAKLPAGTVDFAVGTEFRRETLNQDYSPEWALGELMNYGGTGAAATPAPRMIKSLSAEVNVPILKNLEADVSARDDHYSTFGNTVNPKVSFKWQPVETLMLRGSWGTGFRAPSMTDTSTPPTYGYTPIAFSDPIRCPGGNPVSYASPIADCNNFFQELYYGNSNLQPEKSRQSTLGIMYEPTKNLTLGVNYFHIDIKNAIQLNGLPPQLAFDPATAAQYSYMLVRFPSTTPGQVGSINYVDTPSINEGGWDLSGADLTGEYTFPESEIGKFSVKTNGTYYQKFNIIMTGYGTTGVAGTDNPLGLGVINRWHQYLALNWVKGDLDLTLDSTYWSGYQDYNPYSYYGLTSTGTPNVASYTLFDLTGEYKVSKNLSLSGGIKNLFDRLPPYTNAYAYGWNPALADPRLRSFWVSGNYSFK
jgi:iron complex outermembrane receptor protein